MLQLIVLLLSLVTGMSAILAYLIDIEATLVVTTTIFISATISIGTLMAILQNLKDKVKELEEKIND